MKKNFILTFGLSLLFMQGFTQEILQFRGVNRDGIFNETGLLKKWSDKGPALIWESGDIGNGYGSPAITSKYIFVNGETDGICYLYALNFKGEIQWKVKIGNEWTMAYPGVRNTPTIVDNLAYVTTGTGIVACVDINSRNIKWSADMQKDFHGQAPRFGFSECLLVNDNDVYCTPGSKDTNLVALDRFTGKIKWISKGAGEMTSYCNPVMIKLPLRNILVTFTKSTLVGIDVKDGTLLWSYKQEGEVDTQVNTPLFENGYIYYVAGDGNGAVKLELSNDGTRITEVWKNNKCDNLMGGFIKINDFIYTSGYEKRYWYSLNTLTGAIADSVNFGKGTTNYADGMLYLYNDKGEVGLFKADGPKLEQVSVFPITAGTKAHFAHPVILKGILYIRHGKSLLAYNIKA